MTKVISRVVGAGLIAALLSACGSDEDSNESLTQMVLGSAAEVITAQGADAPEKIELTSKQFAEINVPVIQINPELLGGTDFLQLAASRRDSHLGVVNVWQSSDDAQVFLRNGVVVGSRGVGGDIISADANMTIRALGARAGSSGLRTYIVSDGDVTTTEYTFRCKIENIQSENLILFGQSFSTDYMREDCVGGPRGDDVVRNEYWVQRADGFVRKSRQWMGPRIGYFEVIAVKR